MRAEYLKARKPYAPARGKFVSRPELERLLGGRARFGCRLLTIQPKSWIVEFEQTTYELLTSEKVSFSSTLESESSIDPRDVLKPGDLIEAVVEKKSKAGLSSSSEQSIFELQSVALLVPSLRENPFSEQKFNLSRAELFQKYISELKIFFEARGFVELRTPTLVTSPGLEPFLDPFETQFEMGSQKQKLYLPTSPEFHLKKALTQGFHRIFEIKECFRNGELSPHHQPEFLMLEWYRAYSAIESMITDTVELISNMSQAFGLEIKPAQLITMEDLFFRLFNFSLTPKTTQKEMAALCRAQNLDFDTGDDFDSLFTRLWVEKVEPQLNPEIPTIIHHFPPSQAALARLTSDGWGDRFEIYWKGLELANAFHELNDPAEQKRRFQKDQQAKLDLGKKSVPVDEEFIAALEYGMPPSVGIALGVERLFMALFDIKSLEDCRVFPRSR